MIDAKTLRKAQLKMLEILIAIDGVCRSHNIKYWLGYGTLLGAIRHNGFIPWDDDCDICMMREDFEKFSEFVGELPENMFLQTDKNDMNYPKKIMKIRMKNTKLVEFDESENENYHQGIFVDIFVFDYYPNIGGFMGKLLRIAPELRFKRKLYPKGSCKRAMISVLSGIPYFFHSIVKFLYLQASYLFRNNSALPYVGQEIRLSDGIMIPRQNIFPLRNNISFEGINFMIPNDYDNVLIQRYGDYSMLPSVEQRHTHAKLIEC